jgi:hypothetical protein
MPRMGFEPTILAFKQPNTFYALDREVTVIGMDIDRSLNCSCEC